LLTSLADPVVVAGSPANDTNISNIRIEGYQKLGSTASAAPKSYHKGVSIKKYSRDTGSLR
jgi:hypothetical protein